jgi:transposase-like protein
MLPQFNSLPALFASFPDDATATAHFESIRWKNGAFCPYCQSKRVMHFKDGKTHKCSDCRKRFSIKTGSIFEDTKLGMHIWFAAIWLLTNRPKGIASTQLAVDLAITQKSAWFVLRRLRYAAKTRTFNRPLAGNVEANETYVGGKAKNMSKARREKSGVGIGDQGKTCHGRS